MSMERLFYQKVQIFFMWIVLRRRLSSGLTYSLGVNYDQMQHLLIGDMKCALSAQMNLMKTHGVIFVL
jgi:hypothetical protein